MKAAVCTAFGPPEVVELREVEAPVAGTGEVLVRVTASAVTAADDRIRSATFPKGFGPFARLMFGVRSPRKPVLGGVFAGVVAAVGANVTDLAVGQRVCGMTGMKFGAHAEYLTIKADRCVTVPDSVTDHQAAGVLFGGTTALTYLDDKARVAAGMRVLVNGASGAIGTNAVQLARLGGASVTGVTSGPNVEFVRRLGCDEVIDYTAVDLASIDDTYDVVLDAVGNITPASGRRMLREGGVLLLAVASLGQTLNARGQVKAGPAKEDPANYAALLQLIANDQLEVVVDSVYSLDEIQQAHVRVATGRKVGNVIVSVAAGS